MEIGFSKFTERLAAKRKCHLEVEGEGGENLNNSTVTGGFFNLTNKGVGKGGERGRSRSRERGVGGLGR